MEARLREVRVQDGSDDPCLPVMGGHFDKLDKQPMALPFPEHRLCQMLHTGLQASSQRTLKASVQGCGGPVIGSVIPGGVRPSPAATDRSSSTW